MPGTFATRVALLNSLRNEFPKKKDEKIQKPATANTNTNTNGETGMLCLMSFRDIHQNTPSVLMLRRRSGMADASLPRFHPPPALAEIRSQAAAATSPSPRQSFQRHHIISAPCSCSAGSCAVADEVAPTPERRNRPKARPPPLKHARRFSGLPGPEIPKHKSNSRAKAGFISFTLVT